MWIRSQNRKFLGNYDSFAISESGNILGYQGPEDFDGVVLGAYDVEEKALKVLNNIHLCISEGTQKDVIYQNVRTTSSMVFEMPLEEEVILDEVKVEAGMETGYEVVVGENNEVDFIKVVEEVKEEN